MEMNKFKKANELMSKINQQENGWKSLQRLPTDEMILCSDRKIRGDSSYYNEYYMLDLSDARIKDALLNFRNSLASIHEENIKQLKEEFDRI